MKQSKLTPLRQLEQDLNLCHQRAARLQKESRPGQIERNSKVMRQIEAKIRDLKARE